MRRSDPRERVKTGVAVETACAKGRRRWCFWCFLLNSILNAGEGLGCRDIRLGGVRRGWIVRALRNMNALNP